MHDAQHLIYRRTLLPKAAPERQDLESSIRYLYPWMPDRDFQRFLRLTDFARMIGKALGSILVALGSNELRWKIVARLKGGY